MVKSSKKMENNLCRHCDVCEDFTYQRTTRNGELFKFQYCKGNMRIVGKGKWGPDRSQSTGKTYAALTRRLDDGRSAHFESFLKKNPRNVILHLNDTLDLRMRYLREVSKACSAQTIQGKESIFPGVSLTSEARKPSPQRRPEKPWMARYRKDGKQRYIKSYPTEMEAADAYYRKLQSLGYDVNTQTEAYKLYQNWLHINQTMKELSKQVALQIKEDYAGFEEGQAELEWYIEILIKELKKRLKSEED